MRDRWTGGCKTTIGVTPRLDALARRVHELAKRAAETHNAMVGVSASQGRDVDTSSRARVPVDAWHSGEVTAEERLLLLDG